VARRSYLGIPNSLDRQVIVGYCNVGGFGAGPGSFDLDSVIGTRI
jgi:hypothetical protein